MADAAGVEGDEVAAFEVGADELLEQGSGEGVGFAAGSTDEPEDGVGSGVRAGASGSKVMKSRRSEWGDEFARTQRVGSRAGDVDSEL